VIRQLKAYLLLDFRVGFRERAAIVLMLALPAVMYIFFGLVFSKTRYGSGALSYYDEYTPSFTGIILLNVALMNIGPTLVIYKELGFFRRLLVTPLDMTVVWISAILRATVMFMIGYAEMMLLGYLMFGSVPKSAPLQAVLALLVCCFGLFSFGFFLGSVFKQSNAAFNAGILIFQPMLLLSGASIPLDTFPRWANELSQLIPMTHVVTLLRLAWRNELLGAAAVLPALYLVIFGLVCAALARRVFRWSMS
jgi:ABC-2 type transport system permease protein